MSSGKKSKQKRTIRLWIPSIVLVCLLLAIIGTTTFNSLRTYPLGDRLKYLGKESSGSWLPLSSASPSDLYYYGTEMTPQEITSYFSKAKLYSPMRETSEYAQFGLQTPSGQKVSVNLYKDKNTQTKDIPKPIKTTTDKYIFTVSDTDYSALEASIK